MTCRRNDYLVGVDGDIVALLVVGADGLAQLNHPQAVGVVSVSIPDGLANRFFDANTAH